MSLVLIAQGLSASAVPYDGSVRHSRNIGSRSSRNTSPVLHCDIQCVSSKEVSTTDEEPEVVVNPDLID